MWCLWIYSRDIFMTLRVPLSVHCLGCAISICSTIWYPNEAFASTPANVDQNHRLLLLLLVDQTDVERRWSRASDICVPPTETATHGAISYLMFNATGSTIMPVVASIDYCHVRRSPCSQIIWSWSMADTYDLWVITALRNLNGWPGVNVWYRSERQL